MPSHQERREPLPEWYQFGDARVSRYCADYIGEPFKIMTHYPTVVIQCQCDAKTIISLVFAQVVHTCPACRHRYLITDEMQVGVGAMRPDGSEVVQ